MLSAENVALENRAIRLMLQIREKELNYITNKYNAMGTQAALVGGFTVTTLTSLTIDVDKIHSVVRWLFFMFSALSLSGSISCILNATFVTVWGPGLALRGPRGSMAKAYYGMVYEQKQIFTSFVVGVFFFALQSIVAFWIIDADMDIGFDIYSTFATFIMLSGGTYAFYALRRMHHRFHAMSPDEMNLRPSLPFVQEMAGQASVLDGEDKEIHKNAAMRKKNEKIQMQQQQKDREGNFAQKLKRFSMLGGGLTNEELRASVSKPPKHVKGDDAIPTDFHGYLNKKSHHKGGLQYLHGDPWKSRWFVLEVGRLSYFNSEEEWRQGKPPRNDGSPIMMGAYEVMVNPKDYEWGFMLESIGGVERDWEIRADSEKMRLAWIKVLLKASLSGGYSGLGSDMAQLADGSLATDDGDTAY